MAGKIMVKDYDTKLKDQQKLVTNPVDDYVQNNFSAARHAMNQNKLVTQPK